MLVGFQNQGFGVIIVYRDIYLHKKKNNVTKLNVTKLNVTKMFSTGNISPN